MEDVAARELNGIALAKNSVSNTVAVAQAGV